jgi:hypothetical protein
VHHWICRKRIVLLWLKIQFSVIFLGVNLICLPHHSFTALRIKYHLHIVHPIYKDKDLVNEKWCYSHLQSFDVIKLLWINADEWTTVEVCLSSNSSISKVTLAVYCHGAHYNSPMTLAAYPASRGISRVIPKVSESSTGSAAHTDQLTWQHRLVFIIAHIKIVYRRSPFSLMAESIYRHTPFPKCAR